MSIVEFFSNLISVPSLFIATVLISAVMFINGMSDVPNCVATCVSTRSLSPKRALAMAIIFNFLGIVLMTLINSKVAETIFHIVNFSSNAQSSLLALCSAMVAIVIWSTFTWKLSIPSSQSHALIAGISGSAIALIGNISGIDLGEWKKVIYGLIFVNLFAFILGFGITKLIEKICRNMDRRKTNKFFKWFQILGGASTAFMNGAQDGQKFMGIFFMAVALSNGITTFNNTTIPIWLVLYCSVIVTLGAIIGGVKIIKTIGTKVVKLEKYQAAAADISSSICLLGSTVLGIPVSTTHSKSFAVMGVGASKRFSNVNWNIARNMILTWFITFPGCGFLGYIFTKIFLNIF